MKKVLLLTTSPIRGGNGVALIEAAENAAKEYGAKIERMDIRDLDLHPCRRAMVAPKMATAFKRTIWRR